MEGLGGARVQRVADGPLAETLLACSG